MVSSMRKGSGRSNRLVWYTEIVRGNELQPSFFLSTAVHLACNISFKVFVVLEEKFSDMYLGAQKCSMLFWMVYPNKQVAKQFAPFLTSFRTCWGSFSNHDLQEIH